MSDIAKCAGNGCTVRDRCYRFISRAAPWQAWAGFDIHMESRWQEGEDCDGYMEPSHE